MTMIFLYFERLIFRSFSLVGEIRVSSSLLGMVEIWLRLIRVENLKMIKGFFNTYWEKLISLFP